jgi:hypothetical protein
MAKIEVEIPEYEHTIIAKIATKLGLSVQALLQQETDRTIETLSCWLQRADLLTA